MLCNSKTGFPVFDSIESADDAKLFVLCGGGGSAKSGVANRVSLCSLGPRADGHAGVSLVPLAHFDTEAKLATSCCMLNATTVVFSIENELVVAERGQGDKNIVLVELSRLKVDQSIDLVRACHNLILVGKASGQVVVLEWTNGSLQKVRALSLHLKPIVDITPGPGALVATASADDTVRIWNLQTGKTEHILPSNSLANLTYRKIRFGPVRKDRPLRLFTLQVPKNRKGASFVVVFERVQVSKDVSTWDVVSARQVSPLLVTAMTVSADGRFVAVGSADLSVSMFDQESLAPLRTMNKVHGLPVTGMFVCGSYVVSTSADATCAMVRVDDIGAFDIVKTIRTVISVLALLLSLFACIVVFLVASNVSGSAARGNLLSNLASPSSSVDLSRVSMDALSRFVVDYLSK